MHKSFIIGSFLAIAGVFTAQAEQESFTLSSSDITEGKMMQMSQVYDSHGCNGQNISPQLSWQGSPEGTKSFALICHDPDAPRENGWYHWLVVDIPATTESIAGGQKVEGAFETINDFQQNNYGGPCPPVGHGIHHYNFTLYALDVEHLDVEPETPPTVVEQEVKAHTLGQATLTGVYERK